MTLHSMWIFSALFTILFLGWINPYSQFVISGAPASVCSIRQFPIGYSFPHLLLIAFIPVLLNF